MKLFDCFMYFDEDLVLDIRLHTLNELVDKFIIAEATLDHAGNNKKLNFDINNFSKFKHKIKYIVVEDIPREVGQYKKGWAKDHIRDQFQRNALSRGYIDALDNDSIMISDIDEIPDPKKIPEFDEGNKYACFIQMNFQSKINQLNLTEPNWAGTKICKKKFLKSPQWLRNIKTGKRPFWKLYKPAQPQIIENGGWHFSFLKSPKDIAKKINSFAHQEFNKEIYKSDSNIKDKIDNKSDLFGRDYKYQSVKIDGKFPKYIQNNTDKFKDWIS